MFCLLQESTKKREKYSSTISSDTQNKIRDRETLPVVERELVEWDVMGIEDRLETNVDIVTEVWRENITTAARSKIGAIKGRKSIPARPIDCESC